ncbi:MAG: quinol monooxygenase YgiN [Candidatus Azotimanducaceae bacterium]|jgi:quinol monooxygenase YgiN
MIIVHGTFPIKPELREEALELMRQMSVASRDEHGCASYEFYAGISDPNIFLLFQEWENVEALQGHFQTDHMEDFLKSLPDVLNGEVMTRRYEVRSTDELGYEDDEESMSDFEPEHSGDDDQYREKIVH